MHHFRQGHQFIPQGAINFMEIAVIFVDLFDFMTRFIRGNPRTYYLSATTRLAATRLAFFRWFGYLSVADQ